MTALDGARPRPHALARRGEDGGGDRPRSRARDAERWPAFVARPRRARRGVVASVFDATPPSIDAPAAARTVGPAAHRAAVPRPGREDGYRLLRWGPMPVADLVAEWLDTPTAAGGAGRRRRLRGDVRAVVGGQRPAVPARTPPTTPPATGAPSGRAAVLARCARRWRARPTAAGGDDRHGRAGGRRSSPTAARRAACALADGDARSTRRSVLSGIDPKAHLRALRSDGPAVGVPLARLAYRARARSPR